MELQPYVDAVRHELSVAAAAGGPDAEALASRLTAPLESAIRLALLEALSEAAEQITRDLAPGSVEVRLRGRDPEFTVSSGVERLPDAARVRRTRVRGRRRHVACHAAAAGEPEGWRRRRRPRRRAVGERLARPGGRRRAGVEFRVGARAAHQTSPTAAGSADHHTDKETQCPISIPHNRLPRLVEISAGSVRLVATDRDDTVVEVRPRDESRSHDVKAAEQVRVDFKNGTLAVTSQPRILISPQGSRRRRRRAAGRFSVGRVGRIGERRRRRRVRRLQVRIGQRRSGRGVCGRKHQGRHGFWRCDR